MNRQDTKFTDSGPIPAHHRVSASVRNKFGGSTTITMTVSPDQRLDEAARERVRQILTEALEKIPL
jgi:hypothetical protein